MFYNIAVVGFGLAGRLAALELSKLHHVTVFEADDEQTPNSAGKVAAAMLAPLAESVLCEADLALMGLDSIKRWPGIIDELDSEVFFQQQLCYVLSTSSSSSSQPVTTKCSLPHSPTCRLINTDTPVARPFT